MALLHLGCPGRAPTPFLSANRTRDRRCWPRLWLGAWLAIVVLGACDRAPCAGLHRPSKHKLAPRLVAAHVLPQSSIDPYAFILELMFLAPHKDVSDGVVDLFVGASAPVQLPLKPYFGPSNVAPDAETGRLAVPLNFAQSALQDDALLRLGVQLRDGSYFYSNCVTIEMHVLVDKLELSSAKMYHGCDARALPVVAMRASPRPAGPREEQRHGQR